MVSGHMIDMTELLKFKNKDLEAGGKNIVSKHKLQINRGIDNQGRAFRKYSVKYRSKKVAGKFGPKQVSKRGHPPDLRLTGKMLNEFQYISNAIGKELRIKYGTEDTEQGRKLKENNEDRVIVGDNRIGPLPQMAVVKMIAGTVQKNLKKLSRQPIKVIVM